MQNYQWCYKIYIYNVHNKCYILYNLPKRESFVIWYLLLVAFRVDYFLIICDSFAYTLQGVDAHTNTLC